MMLTAKQAWLIAIFIALTYNMSTSISAVAKYNSDAGITTRAFCTFGKPGISMNSVISGRTGVMASGPRVRGVNLLQSYAARMAARATSVAASLIAARRPWKRRRACRFARPLDDALGADRLFRDEEYEDLRALMAVQSENKTVEAGGAALGKADAPELIAMMPAEKDIEASCQLLAKSFEYLEKDSTWLETLFGPVGAALNSWNKDLNFQIMQGAMRQEIRRIMSFQSLMRPRGRASDGHGLALMLVQRKGLRSGDETPIAFCQLALLPADGRTPEGVQELIDIMTFEPCSFDAKPYLVNFCVSPDFRRQGLGRVMLRVAESVVRDVWGDDELYLHTEKQAGDVAARRGFYESNGYEVIREVDSDSGKQANMRKRLATTTPADDARMPHV